MLGGREPTIAGLGLRGDMQTLGLGSLRGRLRLRVHATATPFVSIRSAAPRQSSCSKVVVGATYHREVVLRSPFTGTEVVRLPAVWIPFSRFGGTADQDVAQRQEWQIVQSRMNLDDSLQ